MDAWKTSWKLWKWKRKPLFCVVFFLFAATLFRLSLQTRAAAVSIKTPRFAWTRIFPKFDQPSVMCWSLLVLANSDARAELPLRAVILPSRAFHYEASKCKLARGRMESYSERFAKRRAASFCFFALNQVGAAIGMSSWNWVKTGKRSTIVGSQSSSYYYVVNKNIFVSLLVFVVVQSVNTNVLF